jgi:hypothetical protein
MHGLWPVLGHDNGFRLISLPAARTEEVVNTGIVLPVSPIIYDHLQISCHITSAVGAEYTKEMKRQ